MIINFACGLLGNLFVLLTSMNSVKQLAEAANQTFVYKKYFEKEMLALIAGVIPLLIYVLTFEEIAGNYSSISSMQRMSFTVVGAIGSYIFRLLLGRSKAWVKGVIDVKTNELDDIKKSQDEPINQIS